MLKIDDKTLKGAAHRMGWSRNHLLAIVMGIRDEHGEKEALSFLRRNGVKVRMVDRGGKSTGQGRNG